MMHQLLLLLILIPLLGPGLALSAELISERVIVEFNSRPDSVSLTGGEIFTGDASVDSLLNDQDEEIVHWEFLWADESPEETFLSRCLMVVYEDTLSLADVDTLKTDLVGKSSVTKSYSDFYLEPHGSWDDFIDGIWDTEYGVTDQYADLQWHLYNQTDTLYLDKDIDWLRMRHYGGAECDSQVTIAVIDGGFQFLSSFTSPVEPFGSGVMHHDFDWSNIWFNEAEDTSTASFIDSDRNLVDSDDPLEYPDDIIGWDFFSCDYVGQTPTDDCTRWANWNHEVFCWDTTAAYYAWGDPFPDGSGDHGSKVVGIINPKQNSDGVVGIVSFAESIKLMCLKAGMLGSLKATLSAKALEYARRMGADIVSMSWGVDYETDIELLSRELLLCHESGMTLVASAANYDVVHHPSYYCQYPATDSLTISVASTRADDTKNPTSCWEVLPGEAGPDIAAPGDEIATTLAHIVGDNWDPCTFKYEWALEGDPSVGAFGGTSAAVPMVASAAALLISFDPDNFRAEPDRVKHRLTQAAQTIDTSAGWSGGVSAKLGHGRLNLFYTLFYNDPDSSQVEMTSPTLGTVSTIVTCPEDTLDNMIFRFHIKNEFGDYVTDHPNILGKGLMFKELDDTVGDLAIGVQDTSTHDSDMVDYLDDLEFADREEMVFLKPVAADSGYYDIRVQDPSGWGEVICSGFIIDANENRMTSGSGSDPYLDGSFYLAQTSGKTLVFTTVDFNGDNQVTASDWAQFATYYYNTNSNDENYCLCADYDQDGDIDTVDLAVFNSHYNH